MSRNPKPVYRIYTRPNSPFWQAWRYADNGSKERISIGLSMAEYTRDEALEIVNRLYMDIESEGEILDSPDSPDNRVHETKSRTLTIEKFTRQLELRLTKKGLAPGTISLYLSALNHLKCVYGREYDVKAINRAAIWKVQEYLMEQPGKAPGSKMSNAAINMNLRHLRGAFGYLVNDEILDRNPFARFEVMFEKKGIIHSRMRNYPVYLKLWGSPGGRTTFVSPGYYSIPGPGYPKSSNRTGKISISTIGSGYCEMSKPATNEPGES